MKTKLIPVVGSVLIGWSPIPVLFAQSAQPMMKAVVLHEHGGPNDLERYWRRIYISWIHFDNVFQIARKIGDRIFC